MTPNDFRRIALTFSGTEESSHMGSPDFRVGGHIFATLAHQAQGFGNLKLTPEQQTLFLADQPTLFFPIAGAWGSSGMTHIRLAKADEAVLTGALYTAWKLRRDLNTKTHQPKRSRANP